MRTSTLVAASLAVASAAADAGCGSAIIKNNCAQDVYLWPTHSLDAPAVQIIKSGAQYSEEYVYKIGGGGVSLKLGLDSTCTNVMQYEYTKEESKIWYDISEINGSPFESMGGYTVTPSMMGASGYQCHPVGCGTANANCNVYHKSDDDVATQNCPLASDLTLELCPGGTGGSVGQNIIPVGSTSSAAPQATQAPVTQAAAPVYTPPTSSAVPAYTPPASSAAPAYTPPASSAAPVASAAPVEIPTPVVAPPSIPYGLLTYPDVLPHLHKKAKRHEHHPAHDHAAPQQ